MRMHRHGRVRFHHGPRHFRPWMPFGGFIWFFLFAMIFMGGGRWLPGIIVLIVLVSVFGSIFRRSSQPWTQNQPRVNIPAPTVISVPVEPAHRVDLLPANCIQCGGPIRASEVRWTGKHLAACPYCGSNLPLKRS